MQPEQTDLARASLLAAELIDICRAAGKPLAADYVQVAIELLTKGTNYEQVSDRWPLAISDHSHEN